MMSEILVVTPLTNILSRIIILSLFQNIVSSKEDVIIVILQRLEENSGLVLPMAFNVCDDIQDK